MRGRLGLLALAATIAAAYAPVVGFGFVDYDDRVYVAENPRVLGGLSSAGVRWAWTTGFFANWHPVTWLSYQLDAELWGAWAGGYHLTSLVLHAATALLVAITLRAATGRLGPSIAAAALFALHPLRVESVAWISERKDVLSGALGVAALWAYVVWARRGGAGRYLLALGLFFFGLAAKPMLVTLPAVLLLVDVWPLGRLQLAGMGGSVEEERAPRVGLGRALLEKLPFLVLAIVATLVAVVLQRGGGAMPVGELPLATRLANAVVSIARYLGKTLWPVDLAAFYPHPAELGGAGWSGGAVAAATALVVAVSVVAWRLRRRYAYLLVGWAWFLVMLAPVLGLVQIGAQAMADRYTYLPSIGLAVAVAWGAAHVVAGRPRARSVTAALLLVVALALALATRCQVAVWRTTETLAGHAVTATSGNWRMLSMLGRARLDGGDAAGAVAPLEAALAIRPADAVARRALARAHRGTGRPDLAARELAVLAARSPDDRELVRLLADAREAAGDVAGAIAAWQELLERWPGDPEAPLRLADLLLAAGRPADAVAVLEGVVARDPFAVLAHLRLADAYARLGDGERAAAHRARAAALGGGSPPSGG